jgi:hypothetical protein
MQGNDFVGRKRIGLTQSSWLDAQSVMGHTHDVPTRRRRIAKAIDALDMDDRDEKGIPLIVNELISGLLSRCWEVAGRFRSSRSTGFQTRRYPPRFERRASAIYFM